MHRRHHGIGMTSQRTRKRLVRRLQEMGIRNPAVLEAMGKVPRHIFVDEALASHAYDDTALPIGQGQFISQPYIIARMTELLMENAAPRRVLEVGSGSGYQTAVLAHLVPEVYSIERSAALFKQLRFRFQELGLRNIRLKHGDGWQGWPEYAPYDGILVAASASDIPYMLMEQLEINARLIMPLGGGEQQVLTQITRGHDSYEQVSLEPVNFVPLLSERL